MSDKVKNAIRDNVLKPEMNKRAKTQIGRVSESYYEANKQKYDDVDDRVDIFNLPVVDVEIIDDRINEMRELKSVPVLHSALSSNLDGRKVQRGDKVLIVFYRNNDANPYVAGRLYQHDEELEEEMRCEKGAFKSHANGHF